MNIIIAKDAGYCFGVRDAVNMAYETAEKYGDVYMLGDIVHNEKVVSVLEEAGAKVVSSIKEIPDNSPVLFRAHGTKTDIWAEAKNKNVKIIDATCPLVHEIHKEVKSDLLKSNLLKVLAKILFNYLMYGYSIASTTLSGI